MLTRNLSGATRGYVGGGGQPGLCPPAFAASATDRTGSRASPWDVGTGWWAKGRIAVSWIDRRRDHGGRAWATTAHLCRGRGMAQAWPRRGLAARREEPVQLIQQHRPGGFVGDQQVISAGQGHEPAAGDGLREGHRRGTVGHAEIVP